MNSALMVLSIPGFSHHKIVDSLLWSRRSWWIITYMVSFVSRKFFLFYIGSVKLVIATQLSGLVNMSRSSIWHSVFHEGIVPFDNDWWSLVLSDI